MLIFDRFLSSFISRSDFFIYLFEENRSTDMVVYTVYIDNMSMLTHLMRVKWAALLPQKSGEGCLTVIC